MAREAKHGIYRIDDVLLRAGGIATLGVLAAAAGVVLVGLANGAPDGRDPGLAALLRYGLVLGLGALCPAGLLWAGFTVRRREKRVQAIWNLLKQNAEISVRALLANSDFERNDLELAVRLLNNRGLDHYVWDREADTIQDAALRATQVHVEKCDACGAAVALTVRIGDRGIPRCPHCHDPVLIDSLEERRQDAIEALRAEHRPVRAGRSGPEDAFSIALFVILLFVFWPAAVVYAWFKWQGRL